jgi:hypothetical protein
MTNLSDIRNVATERLLAILFCLVPPVRDYSMELILADPMLRSEPK